MSHFCLQCGAALSGKRMDGRMREHCPSCGWVYYPQIKVSAAALIEKNGQLLLVQRAQDPWKGCWYLPAGYVEYDEDPARAAEREVREETNLEVRSLGLERVEYFDDDPRGNGLLLVYRCEIVGGEIRCDPQEATRAAFFETTEALTLTGAGHRQVIQSWNLCNQRSPK